jgi:uncharacterized protein (DUF362 family)
MGTAAAGLFVGGWTSGYGALDLGSDKSLVGLAELSNYGRAAVRSALESMLTSIGGIGDLVRPGDHVGIKINLTGGSSWAWSYQAQTGLHPGETYWTHPEILRAIGELLIDAGAGRVSILEAVTDDASYFSWGYSDVGSELGAQFVDLNKTPPYRSYSVRPVGEDHFIYPTLTQNGVLDDLDCIVSLAKSKQHNGAGVTHGMKNLVGTLPVPVGLYNNGQNYRVGIHEQYGLDGNPVSNLRRVILDLQQATPIDLVVNDAISTVLGGEGPWGPSLIPADFGRLIVSRDPVAADAVATQAIGLDPSATDGNEPFPDGINYLWAAESLGLGIADLSQIEVLVASSTHSQDEAPNGLGLGKVSCFPNPFSEGTTFEFILGSAAIVGLSIHDIGGRVIADFPSRSHPAGRVHIDWDGNTKWNHPAPAGAYLAVIQALGSRKTLKLARTH